MAIGNSNLVRRDSDDVYVSYSLRRPINPKLLIDDCCIDLVKTPAEMWPDFLDKEEVVREIERWKRARACGATMWEARSYALRGEDVGFSEWKAQEERNEHEVTQLCSEFQMVENARL